MNGRTKEIRGSVPINKLFQFIILIALEFLFLYLMFIAIKDSNKILFCFLGFIAIMIIIVCYIYSLQNDSKNQRHEYEYDTKKRISKIERKDKLVKSELLCSEDKYLIGKNNEDIDGDDKFYRMKK